MRDDPKNLPDQLPLDMRRASSSCQRKYIFELKARLAVRMAWATGRPLLVVGEAGSGKTDLASALACAWKVPLLKSVISAQSRAEDLLYQFDAVARLADAQIYAALRAARSPSASSTDHAAVASAAAGLDPLNPRHYLRPGPLWWAWNWRSAEGIAGVQAARGMSLTQLPARPPEWQPGDGAVVLIDEIDKAGIELPEGLLDVLDTGGFDVPWMGERVEAAMGSDAPLRPPLVIITSNGARDLPAPFLRRCIALAMAVPEAGLVAWLQTRARAHFHIGQCSDKAVLEAAEIIAADRALARKQDRYVPGVAEYLDLLAAVADRFPGGDESGQCELLRQFAPAVTTEKGRASYQ